METGVIHGQNGSLIQQPYQAPMGGVYQPLEEESGSSIDFWGVIRRRFFLILFFVLVAVGLGTLYVFTATPWYESATRIQIIPEKPVSVDFGARMFSDSKYRDPLSASHPNSMLSTEVLYGVLVEGGMIRNSNTFAELAVPGRPDDIGQSVYEFLQKNLQIRQDRNDEFLYELTFRSKYKEETGRFLNGMVDVYRKSLSDGFQKDINDSIRKLEEVAKGFNQERLAAEREIQQFRLQNPVPKLDPSGTTEARRMVDVLTPQFQSAMESWKEKRAQLEMVQAFQESGVGPAVILEVVLREPGMHKPYSESYKDYHAIERPRETVTGLVVQRQNLLKNLGPNHPQIQNLERQIVAMERLLAERTANSTTSVDIPAAERLEVELRKLATEVAERQAAVEVLEKDLTENKRTAERYAAILEQEAELIEKRDRLYEMLSRAQNSVEEMRVARNDTGYKFNQLNKAVDGVQVAPQKLIVYGLSTILGALVGFGIAYLVDLADKTFRSPHEIIRTLNLALIGHIPVIRSAKSKALHGSSSLHPVLCTFFKPKSHSSEAFRAIRTAIYFSTQGRRHQVIQVTSPTPGDGKTTVAANLAITIAQSGKRVLLVDGDMRRPSLHKLFKVDEKPGFSDLLVEQVPLSEAKRETEIDGLDLLPCGVKPVQPSELLTSYRLAEVMEEFRSQYDFVIIDTPPVLVVTDPCPVAAHVDGVICAMRIKKNVRVSAERMVEILRSVNANIIGIVVNGVGAQGTYSSQYSYGAYQTGYSNYSVYGNTGYGYGRYGQSERPYDDGRRPELALPKRRLTEHVGADEG